MSGTILADAATTSRAKRLKAATSALHEALDARMMGADLFSSRRRYALFLTMQRRFHAEIAPIYRAPALIALIPDLPERAKLAEIDRDMADVEATPPGEPGEPGEPGARVDPADTAAAFGWLYVAEGSSLGAAFLLKAAERIGLSETFGGRHLAGHPEGRGLHWRRFTQALDAAPLDADDDVRAEAAAVEAFKRVRQIAEETLAPRDA